ncbi:hypothetical protein DEJ50_22230 [Streptomyces venezuelae]|uniref:Uncharacterized protein n=1 Tax=Streptomyces venezuelae TaxID=54571 RepID=A0A5P2DAI8_STRVZ|nr:hypothetical protein [Streptomyces venezuelae]QES50139.1 hypothetical protein DEJ50_22230 [Streptomyces venezuelae]
MPARPHPHTPSRVRSKRPAAPLLGHLPLPLSRPGAGPLTSEPPLADTAHAPLTSEPPLTDEAPLTSEPTTPATAAGV